MGDLQVRPLVVGPLLVPPEYPLLKHKLNHVTPFLPFSSFHRCSLKLNSMSSLHGLLSFTVHLFFFLQPSKEALQMPHPPTGCATAAWKPWVTPKFIPPSFSTFPWPQPLLPVLSHPKADRLILLCALGASWKHLYSTCPHVRVCAQVGLLLVWTSRHWDKGDVLFIFISAVSGRRLGTKCSVSIWWMMNTYTLGLVFF